MVRQYRFLLRTAPADALEQAHVEALGALTRPERVAVLSAVQTSLVAGLRLGPDDCRRLAHLMTLGERRVPGALLTSYQDAVLQRLAALVIHSDAAFGLFSGYVRWDGIDPAPAPDPGHMAGWDERWHQKLIAPPVPHGYGSSSP